MKAEILDHVRRPDLPWRPANATECGRALTDVAAHISRDQLLTRLRRDGRARTAMTVCMTCWQTATRWKTFEEDPVDALRREVYQGRLGAEEELAADLRALAALAQAHRGEFDGFVRGLADTTSLAAHRAARRKSAR